MRFARSVSKVDKSELMLEELELDESDDALEPDAPGGGPGGGPPAGPAPWLWLKSFEFVDDNAPS